MRVDLSAEASEQASEIDTWWREHRPSAPDLFENELSQPLARLSETPSLGTPYAAKGVRRLLLRRSHYHVYFVVEAERLYVVAIGSAFRGSGHGWSIEASHFSIRPTYRPSTTFARVHPGVV